MAHKFSTTAFSGDGNQGLQVANNTGIINFTEVSVTQPDKAEKPSPSSTVLFRRDPDFICRDIFLDLAQKKSQLAIEYCYKVREKSPGTWVFWVHASNPARFEEGYRKIAERVKIPGWDDPKADVSRLLCNWLSNEASGKWTMVVDNADDLSIFIAPSKARLPSAAQIVVERKSESLSQLLPVPSHGSILVTSRSRDVALALTGAEDDIITVEPMNESHASALFGKKLGCGYDKEQVAELLEALDFMPLAISKAAAYMRQRAPRISVAKYLSNFHRGERDRVALLETDSRDTRRDQSASNSIIVTWRMSFEHIREQRPSAARLLSFMSFFDRQGIPEFLLHERSDEANDIDHEFENDISILRSYLLISLNLEVDRFAMHRLVQFSMRKWLEMNDEEEIRKEIYIAKMDEASPDMYLAAPARSHAWFPRAEIALSYRPASPDYLAKWTRVMVKASWVAESQGNYPVAEKLAQEALKWRELSLGKESLTTQGAVNQLAFVYYLQGRYDEAEVMYRRVLGAKLRVLGEDDHETLSSFNSLAPVLPSHGKYEVTDELNRQALHGHGDSLESEHPHYLISMSNLAVALARQGKYEAAEKLNRYALEGHGKMLGTDHPKYLMNMGNLAPLLAEILARRRCC